MTVSNAPWPAPSLDTYTLPQLSADALPSPDLGLLKAPGDPGHPPRILVLYGSLRERSYSRLMSEEAIRVLRYLGAEPITFDPRDLPLADAVENGQDHPKVRELFAKAMWSEGMVWFSPERHGAMTGVMKTQIDWLPLALAGQRPTQGRTLALGQVCGGSQSFNSLNQMRILGRWMRMVTIPNQSSVPKAFMEFDDAGRMRASPYFNRLVDVMEELVKFTWLIRARSDYLVDRYSERVETAAELSARVNNRAT